MSAALCYEVNIWDIRPEPKYATGAIVDHAAVPVPIVYKAGGRWNTGPFGLQYAQGGVIKWRKVQIRPL